MHAALKITVAGLALTLGGAPVAAQSDILLQLRSGSPAGDRFRVDSAGGVVALGQLGYGIIPSSGAGWRMMWHPQKAAFRAGYVDAGGQWDESNIGYYSWAGGSLTTAAATWSFAVGNQNTVEAGANGGVALGGGNLIWGTGSSLGTYGVAMGLNNDVLDHAGVAIGQNAWSDGDAAVAIGFRTTADADYSVALGYRASTNGHTGAFVLADASISDSVEASANNQFMSRFAGGYRLYTNGGETTGVFLNAGGSSWNVVSDINLKERLLAVNGEDVLSRIRTLPLTTWRYIGEEDRTVRHIGPMAHDWQRAFGFSGDRTTINMSDIDGVNLAGVQALDTRTQTMQATIAELAGQIADTTVENASLRAVIAALEARITELESSLAASPPRQ